MGPSGRARQIDYILVDLRARRTVMNAESQPFVDRGSDHRAVCASFDFNFRSKDMDSRLRIQRKIRCEVSRRA